MSIRSTKQQKDRWQSLQRLDKVTMDHLTFYKSGQQNLHMKVQERAQGSRFAHSSTIHASQCELVIHGPSATVLKNITGPCTTHYMNQQDFRNIARYTEQGLAEFS